MPARRRSSTRPTSQRRRGDTKARRDEAQDEVNPCSPVFFPFVRFFVASYLRVAFDAQSKCAPLDRCRIESEAAHAATIKTSGSSAAFYRFGDEMFHRIKYNFTPGFAPFVPAAVSLTRALS